MGCGKPQVTPLNVCYNNKGEMLLRLYKANNTKPSKELPLHWPETYRRLNFVKPVPISRVSWPCMVAKCHMISS